ncbi:inhibin beta A chain [Condylostylus longicornis]|uniref:inhibin beta A chain n=1 Tax=Condylostylus longicornis TaxID=2530218 RepID=UPI00244DB0E5|nr:inhibin beta A chain [Condylostylus longicornis]
MYNNNNNYIKCPKCSSSSENNKIHVSQEQLTELRIDFVKRQILKKLRLKNPPHVTAVDYLPQPITEMEYNNVKSKEELDDYYARTSKKYIILEREYKECAFINKNPAICFLFKIDDVDTDNMDVNQAVLWVYIKPKNNNDEMKQTLVVSEFERQMSSRYLPKVKPIAIKSVDIVEGWIKIDIAWPIKKWVGTHELSHLIHITCNSCELDTKDGIIALEKEYQPFIVIDTQYRRQRSRQKRSVNCSADVKECCREKLYISFKEIGWGDWIISPTGYNAYFCRGSCNSIASIASSNNHHSLIIKTLKDKFDRPLELIPCCTAKQFSQLELLFRDSNNTITQKFLPNMIVESCGCM